MSVDFSIPREFIPWQGEGEPGPCPRCGAPLTQEEAVYMVLTRRGDQTTDSFMTNSDKGWFCTQCPVLLLNSQHLVEALPFGLPKWDVGNEFAVAGIVNLDAIPPEKEHLPIGAPGNPIPLVEFSNLREPDEPQPRRSRKRRRRIKKRKKSVTQGR
jgi:hypothetical protein